MFPRYADGCPGDNAKRHSGGDSRTFAIPHNASCGPASLLLRDRKGHQGRCRAEPTDSLGQEREYMEVRFEATDRHRDWPYRQLKFTWRT